GRREPVRRGLGQAGPGRCRPDRYRRTARRTAGPRGLQRTAVRRVDRTGLRLRPGRTEPHHGRRRQRGHGRRLPPRLAVSAGRKALSSWNPLTWVLGDCGAAWVGDMVKLLWNVGCRPGVAGRRRPWRGTGLDRSRIARPAPPRDMAQQYGNDSGRCDGEERTAGGD